MSSSPLRANANSDTAPLTGDALVSCPRAHPIADRRPRRGGPIVDAAPHSGKSNDGMASGISPMYSTALFDRDLPNTEIAQPTLHERQRRGDQNKDYEARRNRFDEPAGTQQRTIVTNTSRKLLRA